MRCLRIIALLICGLPLSALAASAINQTLPDNIQFNQTGFADALDQISRSASINIHVDWAALQTIGVTRTTPITLQLKSASTRIALRYILAAVGDADHRLAFYVDQNVVEITTQAIADARMITRIYPVDDLLAPVPDFAGPSFDLSNSSSASGGGNSSLIGSTQNITPTLQSTADRATLLVQIIQSTIQPTIWNTAGGRASIRVFHGMLIVTAPQSVHDALGH